VENGRIDRLAQLLVEFGANVQPGQLVGVAADIGKEDFARACAAHAYRRGARFVDVVYFDPWVKRARVEHAADETLDYVPPWYGKRLELLAEEGGAQIGLVGPVAPGLLDDLDAGRVGRDLLPSLKEWPQIISRRAVNWTLGPAPTDAWARQVHPGADDPLDALWTQVEHMLRLDEPDPVDAWRQRVDELWSAAARLTERRFDALHYEGPGTDFTVGLLPTSRWHAAGFETAGGIKHMPNLPTEEVFTSPDPQRADGVLTASMPLVFVDGTVIDGLRIEFADGRAVRVDADKGADAMRARTEKDEGAARLGELALVDGRGRIGPLDTVFYNTLLDENAASHIALGNGFDFAVDEEDRPRRNRSEIHIDFMVGRPEMRVTGITRDGDRVPVLAGGEWQI
jgi:aminopeptidase